MARRRPWLLTILFFGGVLVVLLIAASLLIFWMRGSMIFTTGERIAVVRIEGMISESEPVIEILNRFGEDDSVKAMVLRIDSPGGAVGPTQEIYQSVQRWNQTKKILASMGSMATSGGYYVACGAERIFANPGSITGSIGVVVHFANLQELFDKIGVKGQVIKSGVHKDMGSPYRELTSEEKRLLQGVVDDVHQQFIEAVAESRQLPVDHIRSLADGRIFSGRQAMELGLVDELGGLQEAIRVAARMGGIQGEPRVVTEPREGFSLLDLLLGRFLGRVASGSGLSSPFIGYLFQP
jgi:protease-4